MRSVLLLILAIFTWVFTVNAQREYIAKALVTSRDTIEFKNSRTSTAISVYGLADIRVYDVHATKLGHITNDMKCLLNVTGPLVNGKKDGTFITYVIDSADHSKRYKVFEQEYKQGVLEGEWRTFNLQGTRVVTKNFKNDKLSLTREYWTDGKTITYEKEHLDGNRDYIERYFFTNNKIKEEKHWVDNKLNGITMFFSEDGSIKKEESFKDHKLDGLCRYFYPGGKLSQEIIYKEGKEWTIISSYTPDGKPREKGTLKDGNGTLYKYKEDGSFLVQVNYVNGQIKYN